jgi:hypothetical protein
MKKGLRPKAPGTEVMINLSCERMRPDEEGTVPRTMDDEQWMMNKEDYFFIRGGA